MARFKGYRPDPDGVRELARSPEMSAFCVEEAQRGASWANTIDPDGNYTATSATVAAGWSNERRAGAEVTQTTASEVGPRERVLQRAVGVIEGGEAGKIYVTKSGKRRIASQAQIDNWTRKRR